MAEATSIAYKGAPSEVQVRLRRVVDIWKDRAIFEKPIQDAIDARLNGKLCVLQYEKITFKDWANLTAELDKVRGSVKSGFGASPFGGASVPSELAPIVSVHQQVTKLAVPLKATISSADQEYQKQSDPSTPVPSAPVFAARLNGLLKSLANAENAVAECVKAREGLVTGLEQLLDTHRVALEQDKDAMSTISKRKLEIETRKQEVELAIMQALGSADNHEDAPEGQITRQSNEPDRPEMEALTPPSMDDEEVISSQDLTHDQAVAEEQQDADDMDADANSASLYSALPISTNGSNKRRRVDNSEDFPDLGGDDGIDADVAEMLK